MLLRTCSKHHLFHISTAGTKGISSIEHFQNDIWCFYDFRQLLVESPVWIICMQLKTVKKGKNRGRQIGEGNATFHSNKLFNCNDMNIPRILPSPVEPSLTLPSPKLGSSLVISSSSSRPNFLFWPWRHMQEKKSKKRSKLSIFIRKCDYHFQYDNIYDLSRINDLIIRIQFVSKFDVV